jgi:hypothetical protein
LIDEIGDRGIARAALFRDRAGEDPGMAICDQPFFAGTQGQLFAVLDCEKIVIHRQILSSSL